MSETAFRVSSDEVEESKNTTIMDASGLLMLSFTISGSMLRGMEGSSMLSKSITLST